MFEYEYTEGKTNIPIRVRFTKGTKIIGTIKLVKNGWQYFPKGSKIGSKIFKTVNECQQYIENDF